MDGFRCFACTRAHNFPTSSNAGKGMDRLRCCEYTVAEITRGSVGSITLPVSSAAHTDRHDSASRGTTKLSVTVESKLGEGFWSVVYSGTLHGGIVFDCDVDKKCVVKVYRPIDDYEQVQSSAHFHQEIFSLGRLQDSGVGLQCTVFGAGRTVDNWPFVVLEHCGNQTLEMTSALKLDPSSIVKALNSFQSIHKMGFAHNDVHASNVIIDQSGDIRLVDWNSASPWRQMTSYVMQATKADRATYGDSDMERNSILRYDPNISSPSRDIASFGKTLLRCLAPSVSSSIFSVTNLCSRREMSHAAQRVTLCGLNAPWDGIIPMLLEPGSLDEWPTIVDRVALCIPDASQRESSRSNANTREAPSLEHLSLDSSQLPKSLPTHAYVTEPAMTNIMKGDAHDSSRIDTKDESERTTLAPGGCACAVS